MQNLFYNEYITYFCMCTFYPGRFCLPNIVNGYKVVISRSFLSPFIMNRIYLFAPFLRFYGYDHGKGRMMMISMISEE